ncbi:MAG: hypothetical protein HY428_01835 [Candidatus Levybacteria bacterium]|nr:hypothetical protein [Candidatus Levybacteria bacterium]
MVERAQAVSLDLDGVVFGGRIPIQTAVFTPWKYNRPFVPEHKQVTLADRVVMSDTLSPIEWLELQLHARRSVKPEFAAIVERMQADAIFGNTGRPNHEQMVKLTREKLQEAGIAGYFRDIYFKPDGVRSEESKYWALTELVERGFDVVHYDDNARTVKLLAGALPHVRFVIVGDLSSGLLFSRREMESYPNVARIAVHNSGRVDAVHLPTSFGLLPHEQGQFIAA